MTGAGDETPEPGAGERKVVRLPIVPRDAALGDDRPLSDTARAHGGAFHRWVQHCIDTSRDVEAAYTLVDRPRAFARWRARLLGFLKRRKP